MIPPDPPASDGAAMLAADRLARGLQDVVNESKAFRSDVAAAERQRTIEINQQAEQIRQRAAESRRQRYALWIIGGLLLVVCVMAVQTRQSANSSRESAGTSRRTLELVLDCLDQKNGECGRAGAARTSKYLTNLLNGQRYIAQCSRALPANEYPGGPVFDAAFDRCFAAKLAEGKPLPPVPSPSPAPAPSPVATP